MIKYPIGIQSFKSLREAGFVYVDKTALIYRLANKGGGFYFLSRPRRFGKSLLISTLEAYFLGQKELFKGLAIEQMEKDWVQYPVLHMDLSGGNFQELKEFEYLIDNYLTKWEEVYGSRPSERTLSLRFAGIIERAYQKTGRQVVILVDEYDKALLQNLGNSTLHDELRNIMKAVFTQLKSQGQYIRFAMITGVTKFSKVSIFSDLNNLADLTLRADYETLCGISQEELDNYFHDSIQEMADANGYTPEQARDKLAAKYDGYHFSRKLTDIYNPFSLLNAFESLSYDSFWFASGTPTFLIELLRRNDIALDELNSFKMGTLELGNVDLVLKSPIPVLFQSGYLTIKGYDGENELYDLGFPNKEVIDGFFKALLPVYANVSNGSVSNTIVDLRTAISKGDIDSFMLILQSFFAGYDYSLIPRNDLERHYQNVIYAVCKLIGLRVSAEYHTSNGRIDMLIQTKEAVFIFEFKLNVSTDRALRQIERKNYAAQFATDSRKVYKIGVNFDSEIRGIKDWKYTDNSKGGEL